MGNWTAWRYYGFKSHQLHWLWVQIPAIKLQPICQLQSICGTFCYFSRTFGCDTGIKLPDYIKPMTVFQTGNSVLLPKGPAGGWAGPRPEDAKDAAMAALGREHGSFFGLARSSPNKASYWFEVCLQSSRKRSWISLHHFPLFCQSSVTVSSFQ